MSLPRPIAQSMPAPSTGRVHGHFGELVQGRLGPNGAIALISLPCPAFWVEPARDAGTVALLDPGCAARLCAALGLALPDVSDMPALAATMPPGGGAGSSTAALVALARHLGADHPPEDLARACAAAEGASDPLMFDHAERLLFAPREGRIIARLHALPRFEVLGGFLGPGSRTRAEDVDFPDVSDLVEAWRTGPDLAGLAALASESARRCLARRGPADDPTESLASDLGALGFVIAHTGSARGLIFAPGTVPAGAEDRLRAEGFLQVVCFGAGG